MYLYNHIRGEIFSADHFKYILKSKKHYDNLTEQGKNNFLKTFFVNESIMELYFNISNKIFKRSIELEEDENYDEKDAIIQASMEIGQLANAKDIDYTADIDTNTYRIIGTKRFLEYPDSENTLPMKVPAINKVALSKIL